MSAAAKKAADDAAKIKADNVKDISNLVVKFGFDNGKEYNKNLGTSKFGNLQI